MQTLTLTLRPLSAFGTPPMGDTLFGQLCWLLRDSKGEQELTRLLDGYTHGEPFAVVSDAFPSGYVPRPMVPMWMFRREENADRKALRKKTWLPVEALSTPFAEWLAQCKSDQEIHQKGFMQWHTQPHNSISRLTGTTGKGAFAPYALEQSWYAEGVTLAVYVVFDAGRILADSIRQAFESMGQVGFGRDATVGLGKFAVAGATESMPPGSPRPNAVLTLAPCAPQGLGLDGRNSFYQPFTRFGRHGGQAVQLGRPFKTPVLLAKAGAVFALSSVTPDTRFVGQGLGGNGQLSKEISATVHQGYAPVIPIQFPQEAT